MKTPTLSLFSGSSALAVSLLATPVASAMTVLIDPVTNNGSFEFAGGVVNTAKIAEWDGTPDIDNWTYWSEKGTDATDSGVEATGSATDGTMSSFLRGGNAAYNMTAHTIAVGDSFEFSWDHTLRGDRNHSVWLVYDNGGTITEIAASQLDSTGTVGTISGSFTVQSGDPWVGSTVGLGIHSPGAYPEVDNFLLSVTPVPEPATLSILLGGAGFLVLRRRRG